MDGVEGVTAMEINAAGVTASWLDPLTDPKAAVMLAVPAITAVTSPVPETPAVEADDEVHVAVPVKSCVLPSL